MNNTVESLLRSYNPFFLTRISVRRRLDTGVEHLGESPFIGPILARFAESEVDFCCTCDGDLVIYVK